MKTNAIVRIVLFAIAIIVLLGILVTCLAFGLYMFDGKTVVSTTSNSQELPIASDEFTAQTVVSADAIRNLDIEWIAGSILIEPGDNTSTITVKESGSDNAKYQMVCRQSGDTLAVQYCEDSISFPSLGITADVSKDLIITVPADWTCDILEIDAASASVEICNLEIGEVDFDGASGACKFSNCTVGNLSMDTVSGDVEFLGTLNALECDAISANFHGIFDHTPSSVDFTGVSGDFDITLPTNCGFTVTLDSVSGDFSSDFPTTITNGNHVHGDGHCHINADGVSGNITIRNGGYTSKETSIPVEEIHCTEPGCTDPDHIHDIICTDSNCTDPDHDHSTVCTDSTCTDPDHGHTTVCTTSDCTDKTHGHSNSHSGKHHD